MSGQTFALQQHEAGWALRFLHGLVSTEPGYRKLWDKLQPALADRDKLVVELTKDELKLCVEGYEQQRDTLWVERVDVGEGLTKDERPPFTPKQTELIKG